MRLSDVERLVLLWGLPSNHGIRGIKERAEADRDLHILVPEMRPHCLGLEVAKRLNEEGIKHTYATDNMLGILFFKNKVKEVLFFYKELTDHEIIGICGSLYVCLLAHVHTIPIKPVRGGDSIAGTSQAASSLDEYMRLQYNGVLEAADEYIPMDIIQ
jgi:methylthioribose-1-phosphate isomerase